MVNNWGCKEAMLGQHVWLNGECMLCQRDKDLTLTEILLLDQLEENTGKYNPPMTSYHGRRQYTAALKLQKRNMVTIQDHRDEQFSKKLNGEDRVSKCIPFGFIIHKGK